MPAVPRTRRAGNKPGRRAVKVINYYGDEVMKVFDGRSEGARRSAVDAGQTESDAAPAATATGSLIGPEIQTEKRVTLRWPTGLPRVSKG